MTTLPSLYLKWRAFRELVGVPRRIAVRGVDREPAMAFTLLVRDTRPIGRMCWELSWRETILGCRHPRTRLTNLRRLQRCRPNAVTVPSAEYVVTV